jgi:putative ABC transport system permease protein
VLAQRAREFALLRAIGARRRQLLRSVIAEAISVGLLASTVGIAAGVGVARALTAVFRAIGVDLPSGSLVMEGRTIVIALAVGVLTTLVSSLLPAMRASRQPAVAVLRDATAEPSKVSRKRTVSGIVLAGIAGYGIVNGLVTDSGSVIGLSVAIAVVAVIVLGPSLAAPLSRLLGAPLARLGGVSGTLARENARRSPRRTAASAAALMIGVSLVVAATIFGASLKTSYDQATDKYLRADYLVVPHQDGAPVLSPELASAISRVPHVQSVLAGTIGIAQSSGSDFIVSGGDLRVLPDVVDLRVTQGSLTDTGADAIAVQKGTANSHHWKLGDSVPFTFAQSGSSQLRIAAIFDTKLFGDVWMSSETFARHFTTKLDAMVAVRTDGHVDRAELERVLDAYPSAKLQNHSEFKKAQRGNVNQLIALVYAMLALALVIALIGIINTLGLSIMERTRELGLLRAVGMTRRQLRREVRAEAVIIASQGTLIGLALGALFGTLFAHAFHDQGVTSLTVPWAQLAVITVIGGLTGVIAAALPARRATRLDVLSAITTT